MILMTQTRYYNVTDVKSFNMKPLMIHIQIPEDSNTPSLTTKTLRGTDLCSLLDPSVASYSPYLHLLYSFLSFLKTVSQSIELISAILAYSSFRVSFR